MYKLIFLSLLAVTLPSFGARKMAYNVEEGKGLQIAIANEDGTQPVLVTSGNRWHFSPDLSPSAKQVAYSEGATKEALAIVTLNLETKTLEQWTAPGNMYVHPEFSMDERFLAFSGPIGAGNRAQIGIIDLVHARKNAAYTVTEVDGEKRKVYDVTPKIISTDYPSYFPSLSSDGSFVVFQRVLSPTKKDVVIYDLANETLTPITPEDSFNMAPSMSFDDKFVVYSRQTNGVYDLFLYDRNSGNTRQLTNDTYLDQLPNFAADGSVVYASQRGDTFKLYKLLATDIAAGKVTPLPLVNGPGEYSFVSFSGEGRIVQGLLPEIPNPPRSSFGSAMYGNSRIYIAGGHQGKEHTYPKESFLDTLEYYDIETKTWHTVKPRPNIAHGYQLVPYGKYLYAFGGFTYSDKHKPKWRSLDEVDRYDVEKDEWTTVGKLPRPRSSYVVGELEGKAYLIGGWDSTPKFSGDADGRFHPEIDVYDFEKETAYVSPHKLPAPLRRALSSVVWGDEILLLGGIGEGASHFNLLDNVTAFNPFYGTWREFPKLPIATFAPAAGILGNNLFVFGGMLKVGQMDYRYLNHVYRFDMRNLNGKWENTGRFLSEPKGFSQVVNLDCRTFGLLGGHLSDQSGDGPVPTFEFFRWLDQ